MLVIKGASGSGKTTLLMNLIGVLTHSSGQIFWGDTNIKNIDIKTFRSKIGYMGPEPFIITGTVRENLTYGLKEHTDTESIWKACKIADAEGFLKSMNKKMYKYRDKVNGRWIDVSVERNEGPPTIVLTGEAAQISNSLGIDSWHLSLSHTDTMAMASVIGVGAQ